MADKIFIVIPTYNEKGNIEKLLAQIFSLKIPNLNVLVVDDSSPDGTGEVVEILMTTYSSLGIIHRKEKQGLGKAYIAGFKAALEKGADVVMQMDADLSHDPKYIIPMLGKIKSFDLVLGSRYTNGGGVKNWNLLRRLISRFGNAYARLILNLPYQDLTGGFKCYRATVLSRVIGMEVSSLGYNFQIETTYLAHKLAFSIIELPIIFTERAVGKSKFNFKIMIEGFWRVLMLKIKK